MLSRRKRLGPKKEIGVCLNRSFPLSFFICWQGQENLNEIKIWHNNLKYIVFVVGSWQGPLFETLTSCSKFE